MCSKISSRRQPIRTVLLAVIVAFIEIGCGKPNPNETSSGTSQTPTSPATTNPRATFRADPNPVTVTDGSKLGVMKLTWSTTATKRAEIHVDGPGGALLCASFETGSCTTGKWVREGMTFYLQDSTVSKPTEATATLAILTANVR